MTSELAKALNMTDEEIDDMLEEEDDEFWGDYDCDADADDDPPVC